MFFFSINIFAGLISSMPCAHINQIQGVPLAHARSLRGTLESGPRNSHQDIDRK